MPLYVIGVGGTGAKCIESLVYLSSLGILAGDTNDVIKVLFVDPDETNGNLERARNTLKLYQRSHDLMRGQTDCTWMKTKVESLDVWSPFDNHNEKKELQSFFHYNTIKANQPALGHLFDVLYSQEERGADLEVGFRGRPAIGSAVMSRVDLDRLELEPWGSFITSIRADTSSGKRPKVLFCGSVFGGTGASGLPTLATLLSNQLKKLRIRDSVDIGGILTLPYFGFSPSGGETSDGVYARSEQFLLNSEAALRYYGDQASKTFDLTYLLGNQTLSRVDFSIGKDSQRNSPHFVELYAGLAARHFLLTPLPQLGSVVVVSREQLGKLVWDDLPDCTAIKPEFVNAARFAFIWLADISPELENAKQYGIAKVRRGAPWLEQFFNPRPDRDSKLLNLDAVDQQNAITLLDTWCDRFLRWIFDLHQCQEEQIQLFNISIFGAVDGALPDEDQPLVLQADNLPSLVLGDGRDRDRQVQDRMIYIKRRLNKIQTSPPQSGVTALAQALYMVCRL